MKSRNKKIVKIEDMQCAFVVNDIEVRLTKTESRLLHPLRHVIPMTYVDLARIAYGCEVDEQVRVMIDKHVDRIRGKMRGTGMYIYCIVGYGYLLLNEDALVEGSDNNIAV